MNTFEVYVMANTSLSFGEHWEVFIKNEISTGRYGSASEVVRDALRTLEERKTKLSALRTHLGEGAKQAESGDFVDASLDSMLDKFKTKRSD
jgi:antitoxin ParD1/3/4